MLAKLVQAHVSTARITISIRALLIIALSAAYIAVYLLLHSATGASLGALVSLPAAIAAWFFGLRIGLVASVLAVALNLFLLSITGDAGLSSSAFQTGSLLGYLVMFFFTTVLGALHELSARLRQEPVSYTPLRAHETDSY